MLFIGISALSLLAFQASAQSMTTCNANNCLRQVRATQFPSRSSRQDCSAYQTTTTTSIITSTSTVTTVSTTPLAKRDNAGAVLEARQEAHTVPAYASSCGPAAYASACNCIGIPASTVTTSTTTTTTTTAVVQPTNFALVINYPASSPNTNVTIGARLDPNTYVYLYAQPPTSPSVGLSIGTGLTGPLKIASGAYAGREELIGSQSASLIIAGDRSVFQPVSCSIDAVTRAFTCKIQGVTGNFFLCPVFSDNYELGIATGTDVSGRINCQKPAVFVTLSAIPSV